MYRNPILYADYSDPDVIRVGSDFYMVASSFTYFPGVPILHSQDLVHWQIINYAVKSLPFPKYDRPCHGSGTWAPSIRYHNGEFFVFIPLVDEGIFVARSRDIRGEFQLNCLVQAQGWIDPCPFWDADGRAYMVFAYARSRCGIKHRLSLVEIDPECTCLLGEPQVIFHREDIAPTIEGPKMYAKDGFYYIFAPAGGVATGWQMALRSKNIWGPYTYRIVLSQGATAVNGPHQGGWVTDTAGKDWFIHFQDVGALGRITHLQPMIWQDGWPIMGQNGSPVKAWAMPEENRPKYQIAASDDFTGDALGMQWQWQANPQPTFYRMMGPGLALNCLPENCLWTAPNVLTQIPQHRDFRVSVDVTLHPEKSGDFAALGILGHEYGYLALEPGCLRLYKGTVTQKEQQGEAEECLLAEIPHNSNHLSLSMEVKAGFFRFSYNGKPVGGSFPITPATWTGAKIALWSANKKSAESNGFGEYQNFKEQAL